MPAAPALADDAGLAPQDAGALAPTWDAADSTVDASVAWDAAADAETERAEAPAAQPQPPTPSPDYGSYPAPPDYGAPPVTEPAQLEGIAGAREHEGFFLRLQLGPGAGRTHYKERVDGVHLSSVDASGLSGTFELSVGGRAVGNLIVHGNLSYTRFASPTRQVDGVTDAALAVRTTALLLGAGVTYYFMPYNVFLSGSLGPAWLFEDRSQGAFRSTTGFFIQLAPGKEWWVGARGTWGLGAALRLSFAVTPVEVGGVASTLKYGDIALAFSATFN